MLLSDNLKLVHYAARRAHARILSSGIHAEYDDVFQDTAIVWLACEDKFDASRGYQFTTYFVSAANLSVFRGYQKKNCRFNADLYHIDSIEEGDKKFEPADMSDSIEDEMQIKEWLSECSNKLSPLSGLILSILTNPPIEILDSLQAIKDKAKYARSKGVERRAYKELNVVSLCQILNLSRWHRKKIKQELESVFNG